MTWLKDSTIIGSVEDEQVVPASETETPKPADGPASVNKTLLGIIVILALVIVGSAAFIFGSRQKGESTETPSPTPEASSSSSPSPSSSPSGTPKATPTPQKSATPTPTPSPISQTIVISSEAALDGFRSSNNGGNAGVDIRAGRNVNLITRGFASFNLSGIPSGATIEKATLRLYQYKIQGSPYGVGGSLKIDHLAYPSLDNAAYSASSFSASFGILTENAVIEWKDLEVTDRLKDDIANSRSRSQYRLHFAIESIGGTVEGDFAYFESPENTGTTGNTPQLVVKYH